MGERTTVILIAAKDLRSCFVVQLLNNCRDPSLRSG